MGQPASRVGDMHLCPMVTPGTPPVPHVGGPVLPPCAVTVITGGIPQARVGDLCVCVGPPDSIVKGSTGVFVNSLPAARLGDTTAHGGALSVGLPTVLIGEVGGGAVSPLVAIMVEATSGAAGMSNQSSQAATLTVAHQDGAYFCRRCNE